MSATILGRKWLNLLEKAKPNHSKGYSWLGLLGSTQPYILGEVVDRPNLSSYRRRVRSLTVYLLRSPANARKLLAALERSMERDVQTIPGQTVTELCQELGIERQE